METKTSIPLTLGTNLRNLRTAENMTQHQLAKIMQITEKTVSNIERGTGWIRLEHLEKITEIFHITCSEILKTDAERKNELNKTINQIQQMNAKEKLKIIEQILTPDNMEHLPK